MKKIFVLGDSRTGTTSLHAYFLAAGLRSIHYYVDEAGLCTPLHLHAKENLPKFLHYIESAPFDAFSDYPTRFFYQELCSVFPDAYFILSVRRDLQTWMTSFDRYFGAKGEKADLAEASLSYVVKNVEIESFFSEGRYRFLKICIEDGGKANAEKVRAFIEAPDGPAEMPHAEASNVGAQLASERYEDYEFSYSAVAPAKLSNYFRRGGLDQFAPSAANLAIPRRQYALAVTPCVGDNRIAAALSAAGLGYPNQFLSDRYWAKARDVLPPLSTQSFRRWLLGSYGGRGGVFGVSVDARAFLNALAAAPELALLLSENIVFIARRDLLQQAIIFHRSEVSDVWSHERIGAEDARSHVTFDLRSIITCLADIIRQERLWMQWFKHKKIRPKLIWSEDLDDNPLIALNAVAEVSGQGIMENGAAIVPLVQFDNDAAWASRLVAEVPELSDLIASTRPAWEEILLKAS